MKMKKQIDSLVQQAEELKSIPFNSPKIDLWRNRVKKFVMDNYGQEYLQMLDSALFFSQVIMSDDHGQQMHVQAIEKTMELLEGLKSEPVFNKDNGQQTRELPKENKSLSKKLNYGDIQISGSAVVFGDGAKITQVAVREFVEALKQEIEENVGDSNEKRSVLQALKALTTNETFASVSGTFIGEVLRRVTR